MVKLISGQHSILKIKCMAEVIGTIDWCLSNFIMVNFNQTIIIRNKILNN